jgi:DNA-binding winged helix-turn-helix (wHTH) protein/TolB-like protein/Tfp pilus assembly protein PilF
MSESQRPAFCFGPFRLDVAERLLSRNGEPISLPPKAFETLVVLVENSGRLVTKKELTDRLWPDAFVEEANLANNVSLLRKVLDDDRQDIKYIETVPKWGYRFTAKVTDTGVVSEIHTAVDTAPTPGSIAAPRITTRWIAGGLACLLVAVAGGYYFLRSRKAPRPPQTTQTGPSPIKSIAVLPLSPLVESSRDEYLEMGLADNLITRLSRLRQIEVRSIGAVSKYTGLQRDPMAIGQEQQVDAVLDGTIQKADNKIRVSVRLIRIADGTTLWAGEFDENYTDIFTLQSAISDRVAEVVITKLSAEEKQALHKRDTDNIEAYNLYLTGRYFWTKFTEEGLEKSIDYFNQALAKDPNYAMAYNGLAASHVVLGVNYRPPREVMPKAKAYIEKALDGDAPPADAYMLRGAIKYFFDWDWSGAENDFKRAIELGPSDAASAHQLYAYYLWAVGRLDEGMVEIKRAHELDPASLQINEDLGVAYYYLRDFDQAIQQQHKTINLDSNYFFGYVRRGQAYLQKSMYKEAIDDLIKARTLSGNWPAAVAELGCAYAMAGQENKARVIINELNQRAKHEYIDPYLIALVQTSLGDNDAAIEWLTKAFEARSPWMAWLKVEPKFDRLRSDPRFVNLLHQVGLPE